MSATQIPDKQRKWSIKSNGNLHNKVEAPEGRRQADRPYRAATETSITLAFHSDGMASMPIGGRRAESQIPKWREVEPQRRRVGALNAAGTACSKPRFSVSSMPTTWWLVVP